ncbi:hypothetical protein QQF64_000595 [Cirrhinus molitorella]|uniref:Uncharacterized protein n=1 Tax=Cirrhinus molitorella TaxID=172907 RepID=A0ABR3NXL9_9TELE
MPHDALTVPFPGKKTNKRKLSQLPLLFSRIVVYRATHPLFRQLCSTQWTIRDTGPGTFSHTIHCVSHSVLLVFTGLLKHWVHGSVNASVRKNISFGIPFPLHTSSSSCGRHILKHPGDMKACLLVSACVCVRGQSSSHKLSIMVKTLNELSQLKDTGFGQPRPRHGLNLLYWFAQDYITFSNGDIVSNFQPQKGDFGFHKYQNRVEDDDDDHIVPVQNLPYYEVGNLNAPGANKLPDYVKAYYSKNPDSNKDRIIVRQDTSGYFNRVYVTEHNDPKRFDKDRTYRVSQGLLWNIKNTSREQFLKLTSNTQQDIRIIVMSTVRTLSYLSDLRETGFGHPPPRHGLNLLWWFAHECVQIDFNGRLTAECNPTNGAFGFHRFHNRDGLLPYSDLLYYEVGNLNSTDSLPDYVTKNHTRYSNNSNKDRIIVSFDPRRRRFENIYVTQHSDQVNFDQNHTYRISAELIKDIQDLSYEEFLREPTNRSAHASIAIHKSAQANTCPSNSNELIQDMIWEEILREPTNHSEDVSIGIHQSEQTNSCQSTSNELQDIQDLSWEEYNRELLDDSIDVPQSVQANQRKICQSKNCCWALLFCSLLIVLLIIAGTVYLLLKMKI